MLKKYFLLIPIMLTGSLLYAQSQKKNIPVDTASKKSDTTQIKKHELNEVVISASRISESILRSPISIKK